MDLLTLLSELKKADIYISVSDDKLRVKAPKDAMTEEIGRAIKQQRDSLVDLLGRVEAVDSE
ncbi:MAG: hypothetical protein JKX81_14080, partial [Arenicella sp.]|nr:hypothetical protein [Arenicella sp.]